MRSTSGHTNRNIYLVFNFRYFDRLRRVLTVLIFYFLPTNLIVDCTALTIAAAALLIAEAYI